MKQQTLTPSQVRAHVERTITEEAFQCQVLGMARANGWLSAHFRPAKTAKGRWLTPVAGDGAGFPDIILVRERVVYAELKTQRGKLSPEQVRWLDTLKAAGEEVYVWRPSDWAEIGKALSR